jgi:heme exporter protein CcmD
MDEHGAFIWWAYAVTAGVMAGLILASLHGYRRVRRQLERLQGRTARDQP